MTETTDPAEVAEAITGFIEEIKQEALAGVVGAAETARDEITRAIPSTKGAITRVGLSETVNGATLTVDGTDLGVSMLDKRVKDWARKAEFGGSP